MRNDNSTSSTSAIIAGMTTGVTAFIARGTGTYLDDRDRTAGLIRKAEAAGFQCDD
jgi:hypothetical protein